MRLTSIVVVWILTVSLVGGLSAETRLGRDIITAVVRFLLFYGGVFALIALTAAVGIGIAATDRIVMSPRNRVAAQAIHRAVSLGAITFLVIHIMLEMAAERSRAIDAVVPFLAKGRTFYIGLGTIASDLILVIMVSGFLRSRFARGGRPWAWRAVHALAYLSWLLSIVHGLLGGRIAKPYVDWSYGACVAAVALALVIRMVATTRSRQEVALAAGDEAAYRSPWPSLPPMLAEAGAPQQLLPGLPSARALPAGPSSLATTATELPVAPGGLPYAPGRLHPAASLPAGTGHLPSAPSAPLPAGPLRSPRTVDELTGPRLGCSSGGAGQAGPGGAGQAGPGGLGRHRSTVHRGTVSSAWDALPPDDVRTDPGIPATPASGGIREFGDGPRPGSSPGSVWAGVRQPDAVSTPDDPSAHLRRGDSGAHLRRDDPWAHLRPREDPWAGLQPGYPYPARRGEHHRAPEPDDPLRPDGLPRWAPRIARTYGGRQ